MYFAVKKYPIQYLRNHFEYNSVTGVITKKQGWKKGKPVGCKSAGYITISLGFYEKGLCISAHRLAWILFYGEQPPVCIDHINRNGLDNRITNLRKSSSSHNAYNKLASNNKTGHRGIFKTESGRYFAKLNYKNNRLSLGRYDTIEEAVEVRKKVAIALYGHIPEDFIEPEINPKI